MKQLLFAATISGLVYACSSSDSAGPPACTIPGTYSMKAQTTTETAGCSAIKVDPNAPPTAVTITDLKDGTFGVQITGLGGGCIATQPESCKLQTKCDLQVTDAIDPNDAQGTFQAAWTFSATGFTGTNTTRIPRAKSVPDGCENSSSATAPRQ